MAVVIYSPFKAKYHFTLNDFYRLHTILKRVVSRDIRGGKSNTIAVGDVDTNFINESSARGKSAFNADLCYETTVAKPAYLIANDLRNKLKCVTDLANDNLRIDISTLNKEQINNLITNSLAAQRFDELEGLLKQCQNLRKFPSVNIYIELLLSYSDMAKIEKVLYLKEFCRVLNPSLYKNNANFDHYLAKAQCNKGYADKGLTLFLKLYKENVLLRVCICRMMKVLIEDAVSNRSEASLVVYRKYVERLCVEWNEYYPLTFLWKCCWQSSWFSDHLVADELVSDYELLQSEIKNGVEYLTREALIGQGNEDAIVRLLQLLLKYHMLEEYGLVIRVLFDYKLRLLDLRGCTEILQNCKLLGIELSPKQHKSYIEIVIDGKHVSTSNKPQVVAKLPVKQFKLKF